MNSFFESTDCPAPTRGSEPRHKVVITGTGRAGTTFLVQLLTALELDTGYDPDNWHADYSAHCAAGLEKNIEDPEAPYIVKDPDLCVTLGGVLNKGGVVVDHAIVPVRELESAAFSRMRTGGGDHALPGGLLGTDDPARQQAVLAERFHTLVHTLVDRDIPCTFLHFPRFVRDAEYAFNKLQTVFPELKRDEFMAAFAATANPRLVHDFGGTAPARSAEAIHFEAGRRAKHRIRGARRFVTWSVFLLALASAIGGCWLPVGRDVVDRF